MFDIQVFWLALFSGVGVVAATAASRRLGGTIGGILAASPVTPTASLLLVDGGAQALQGGIASIAATLVAILVGLTVLPRGHHMWALLAVAPLALLVAPTPPLWLAAFSVVAAMGIATTTHIPSPAGVRPNGPSAAIRFLVGSGAVVAVALTNEWLPSMAPLVAVFPVLFVSCTLAAHTESGYQSRRMLQGGGVGSMGVLAFVFVAPWQGLVAAWISFALAAATWSFVARRLQQMGRPKPRKDPAIPDPQQAIAGAVVPTWRGRS